MLDLVLRQHSAAPLGYGHRNIGPNGDLGLLEFLMLSVGSNSDTTSAVPTVLWYYIHVKHPHPRTNRMHDTF